MRRLARRDRGLTLLELIVAIFVLSVGSIAALRAVDQSRLSLGGAEPRLLAQLAVRNRAEELRITGLSGAARLPDRVTLGAHSFTYQMQTEATAGGLVRIDLTAQSAQGPGAALVLFLPLTEPGQ